MNFRVLWVARGSDRKEGLRRLARDMDGPQGEASGLFWFTHESQYLDKPERVLESVWQKGRNEVWLNPDVTDPQELTPLLHPYTVKALKFYPVSKAVNRAGVESPELIQKVVG